MEGPLYGETTKSQKMVLYTVVGALGLLTLAALICGCFGAFKYHVFTHIVLDICIVIFCVAIFFFVCSHLTAPHTQQTTTTTNTRLLCAQWRWYLSEHIHPKFKYLIGVFLGALVIADIAGIAYVVSYKPPEKPKKIEWFVA